MVVLTVIVAVFLAAERRGAQAAEDEGASAGRSAGAVPPG